MKIAIEYFSIQSHFFFSFFLLRHQRLFMHDYNFTFFFYDNRIVLLRHQKANPPACMQRIPCTRKDGRVRRYHQVKGLQARTPPLPNRHINCARVAHAATHSTRVTACLAKQVPNRYPYSQNVFGLLCSGCDKTTKCVRCNSRLGYKTAHV